VVVTAAPEQPVRESRDSRDEARRSGRFRGKEDEGQKPRREEKERKPKKPTRDPKTGAVVNFDEERGSRGADRGPKVPTKSKPHTFNPFANLATILKDKQGGDKNQE
jgi:hypothetical protein